jgi:hypothetical protein
MTLATAVFPTEDPASPPSPQVVEPAWPIVEALPEAWPLGDRPLYVIDLSAVVD